MNRAERRRLRRERRSVADQLRHRLKAEGRDKVTCRMEITDALEAFLTLDPQAVAVLRTAFGSMGDLDPTLTCFSCDRFWACNCYPDLLVKIFPGIQPTETIVGLACSKCAQRLGREGVGRAVADYLNLRNFTIATEKETVQ